MWNANYLWTYVPHFIKIKDDLLNLRLKTSIFIFRVLSFLLGIRVNIFYFIKFKFVKENAVP